MTIPTLRKALNAERKAILSHPHGWSYSDERRYYVYALLNPLKPGPFRYQLAPDKIVEFTHQPFYIGKGSGERMRHHEYVTETNFNEAKAKIRDRILKARKSIIALQVSRPVDEVTAFAYERLFIKGIGRAITKSGPLTNLTDGGDGTSGKIVSDETRERMRLAHIARHAARTPEQKVKTSKKMSKSSRAGLTRYTEAQVQERMRKRLETWNSHTEEEKAKYSRARSKIIKNVWAQMSTEEKELRIARIVAAKLTAPTVKCPYCKTAGKGSTMKRWHFENCRNK